MRRRLVTRLGLLVGGAAGALGGIADLLLRSQDAHRQAMLVAAAAIVLLVTFLALGMILAGELARPLRSMVDAAAAVARGDVGRRIGRGPIKELNVLADAVNQLAERVETQTAQLTRQAFYDPLCGLPNRSLFLDRLQRALAQARRRNVAVAVMYLDLDNFKYVNDSLGHTRGDRLLTVVAERIQSSLRQGDTAARLGADEFAVLLDSVADVSDPVRVAERIVNDLRAPIVLDGRELFVGTSIGIAISRPGQGETGDLLREADVAMYRAKQQGKGHYAIFDPSMQAHVMDRLALETDLRRAVERQEFRVYYQPIVELATGAITGVEALVRWNHPQRGIVLPGEFIQLAEETGLILPIGRWVLGAACRQIRIWEEQRREGPPLTLSVNLSARQFSSPVLVEEISTTLRQTGFDPNRLILEITETVAMEGGDSAVEKLHRLKALGIKLAVDDFGTGYSTLTYLKRFPIDTLKIDRSFTQGLGRTPEDMAIVGAVIAFARSLSLTVTSEGIETEEQLEHTRRLGSDRGQGYLFARPLESGALGALLETGTAGAARRVVGPLRAAERALA